MEPRPEFLCRMGDNALVLGHRLSEWCGHAPVLEEDIAVANIALDLIGQATLWLGLAGAASGKSADDLAYLRDAWEFRNVLLVEQPNGDYGQSVMRQFLFDAWHVPMLEALGASSDAEIAEVAAKSVKEARYHLERSRETVIGLGDGTEASHARMQAALDRLWPYSGEFFHGDAVDAAMAEAGAAPEADALRDGYFEDVRAVMAEATLTVPDAEPYQSGGRSGARHSEHLGPMLAQMQWLQRAYPGATW